MTLYEIDEAIENLIDEETGEITDVEALNALEMARDDKVTYVALKLKNARALGEALKAEKLAIEKRQKAAESTVENCKKWIMYAMNGAKLENERVKISYRTADKVIIDENKDINTLPPEFVRIKKEANKDALKDAMKAGQEIDGCHLIKNTSVIVK